MMPLVVIVHNVKIISLKFRGLTIITIRTQADGSPTYPVLPPTAGLSPLVGAVRHT